MQRKNKDITAVNLSVDYTLRAAPGRGERIFPAEGYELNIRAVSEAGVQLVNYVFERTALDRQITRRSDKYMNVSNIRDPAYSQREKEAICAVMETTAKLCGN